MNPSKTVIIINDDESILTLFHIYLSLRRPDLKLVLCRNSEEANSALKKRQALDLLITDLERESKNSGQVFISAFRKLFKTTPILVVSGTDMSEQAVAAIPSNGFVRMPFDGETLLVAVDQLLKPSIRRPAK